MEMTDAKTLPDDIKAKLLAIRDALVKKDINEAYHVLYTIANPNFDRLDPWKSLESKQFTPPRYDEVYARGKAEWLEDQ